MRLFLTLVIAAALLPSPLRAQEPKADISAIFTGANTLLQQKKYAEALVEYRKILAVEPDLEGPLQNGAMAAYFSGDYPAALQYYRKLKAGNPNSGFLRTKLVQVYQAMGDEKACDSERAGLVALHLSGKDNSTLAKQTEFCRDQYTLESRKVLVYEPFVFAPRKGGMFAARYQFMVLDKTDTLEVRIEAGWDAANKDPKGVYKPDLSFGSFYFDAYYPNGDKSPTRKTKGLLAAEPTYAATKAYVQAILENKVK